MNKATNRLRGWIVGAIAATTMLSTGIVIGSGSIANADLPPGSSLAGLSQPTIFTSPFGPPINGQAAGNLLLSLNGGGLLTSTISGADKIVITTVDNGGNAIDWNAVPTFTINDPHGSEAFCIEGVTAGCTTTDAAPVISTDTLTFWIKVPPTAASPAHLLNGESILLSGITYNVNSGSTVGPDLNCVTTSGADSIPVAPSCPNGNIHSGAGDFSTNAVIATAPTLFQTLRAVSTPNLLIGGLNQTGGNWNLQLTQPSGEGTTQISAGDTVNIVVADHSGNNCNTLADPDTIGFASVPTLNITAGSGAATGVPTATASVSAVTDGPDINCAGTGVNNMLTITFTNTVTLEGFSSHSDVNIQITNVKYNLGGGATITGDSLPAGNLCVSDNYLMNGFSTPLPFFGIRGGCSSGPFGGSTTGVEGHGPSNGEVVIITAQANNPVSDIQLNVTNPFGSSQAVNQPISPLNLTESAPGSIPSGVNGWTCVDFRHGNGTWDAQSGLPTITGTNGLTVSNISVLTTGSGATDDSLVFQVTGGSAGAPGVLTLSNLHVSVPQSVFVNIVEGLVRVTYGGSDPSCDHGFTDTVDTKVFSVTSRIFGVDAEATADQAFQNANPVNLGNQSGGNEAAVLTTDTAPYDALAASYLASQLDTGIVLTPQATISTETLRTLAVEGVEHVYVLGGPVVISQNVINQLMATTSYYPGGVTPRLDHNSNSNRLLDVQWIWGQTADDTASLAAQYVGAHPIGTAAFQAGYGGMYNDTAGSNGTPATGAPDAPVNTAILATDTGFQDSASASVMAYRGVGSNSASGNGSPFPLILTGPAALSHGAVAALDNDGIQQVIVMGGPLAISDNVVNQLMAMGLQVMRIAGTDFGDTSVKTAEFELNTSAPNGQADGLGFTTSAAPINFDHTESDDISYQALSFARGDFYTDSIVSAQINSIEQSPMLLTVDPNTMGTALNTFLATEGNPATAFGANEIVDSPSNFSVNQFILQMGQLVFGGPLAFSSSLESAVANAIGPDQFPF